MRILIVGLGSIGQRHVRNLRALLGSQVEILAYRARGLTHVLTEQRDIESETNVLQKYGIRAFTDLSQALEQRPDAVLICNPTSMHVPVALSAAKAGCHLFIEKPVSDSMEGLDCLATIVREKGLQVLVGFQFRFDCGLRNVKQLIDERTIGPIIHAEAHWGESLLGWHPWEDYRQSYSARADLGGGVILTLSHPFDYLRWFLGETRTVSAVAARISGLTLDVEDTADVSLQFESGAIATVHLDYIQCPPSHWLQLTGRIGTIKWNSSDDLVKCYRAAEGKWETLTPVSNDERNTAFLAEMQHFLDCVSGQAEPLVSLDDGIRALAIALAAKRSAAEGRMIEV